MKLLSTLGEDIVEKLMENVSFTFLSVKINALTTVAIRVVTAVRSIKILLISVNAPRIGENIAGNPAIVMNQPTLVACLFSSSFIIKYCLETFERG